MAYCGSVSGTRVTVTRPKVQAAVRCVPLLPYIPFACAWLVDLVGRKLSGLCSVRQCELAGWSA